MQYLLQAALVMAILYVPFALWLKNETFFKYNRGYLLAAMGIAIFAPFAPDWIPAAGPTGFSAMLEPVITTSAGEIPSFAIQPAAETTGIGFWDIAARIYIGIAVLFLARIAIGIAGIIHVARKGKMIEVNGHKVIVGDAIDTPFSFFKWIFIPAGLYQDREAFEPIFRHEAKHVELSHSFDTMLAEVMCAIMWINPFVYLYKAALKAVHEYQADEIVEEQDVIKYTQLLIAQSQSGLQLALTNQFFQSQLKSRIMMMMRQRSNSNRKWKYMALIPLLGAMTIMFSFKAPEINNDLVTIENEVVGDPDEMPKFPGCKDQECSNQKLIGFIMENLKYPTEAEKAGAEGRVVIKFTVTAKGALDNINIAKGMGYGCDEEAARVIKAMNDKTAPWTPGMKDGKAVAVEMALPIMFKLPPKMDKASAEVDEMPRFPGCEDISNDAEKQTCSTKKLVEYVFANLKYPKDAAKKEIEGTVVAQFTVEPNGLISSIQIVKGLHPSCDVEVVRVLETTNDMGSRWVPAMKDGKPVETKLTLPVNFKL